MADADKNSLEGYYSAINWLAEHRPHMVSYITALGAPQNDRNTKRAMVVSGRDLVPKLYANNEFLLEIGPAMAAGVLVHEWRHVLLNHLGEALNPKPEWWLTPALDDAHEVIINDHLEIAGYSLPADAVRGSVRGPHFYGYWTTDEAYGPMEEWYLAQQQNSQEPPEPEENEQSDDKSDEDGSDDGSNQGQDGKDPEEQDGTGESQSSEDGGSEPGSQGSEPDEQSGSNSEPGSGETGEGSEVDESSGAQESSSGSGQGSDAGASAGSDGSEATPGTDGTPEAGSAEGGSAAGEDKGPECGHGQQPMIEDENGELREMDDQEKSDFNDKLNELIADAIRQAPMPEEEKPTEDELDNLDGEVAEAIDPDRGESYSKAGTTSSAAEQILAGGKLHLGWLKLLQRINPNVGKEDGGIQNKAAYNWARPRRTTSLIRGAHLPSYGAPRDTGAGTTLKPTVLIALDFSGSIDRRLANAMKDMAQSIPEEHIEAHCFTFSTEAIPFNFKASSNRTASGGTDFSCIELEARKIQKKTGQYPYVMCLTDGEAWFGFGGYYGSPSAGASPTQTQLDSNWLWVDVNTEDDRSVFTGPNVDSRLKKQINLSALPYNRSKL